MIFSEGTTRASWVFNRIKAELVLRKIYDEMGESETQALESIMRSMEWKPKIAEKLTHLDELG